jgi:MFS family permease
VLNAYSGWFSDFVGRRRVALAGTAMGVVTPLLFLWFLNGPKNVGLGIVLAALWGLGTGIYYGITEVVPGDVARLASRGALIGTFRFFRDTGNVIVPLIFTGILLLPRKQFGSELNLFGLTLWATAFMMLLTLALVFFVMRETFLPSPPAEEETAVPTAKPVPAS